MYLFITYGKKGIKGIQVRGLRVASCFDRNEVVFLNDGESDFIKKEGYRVIDMDFNQIVAFDFLQKEIFDKIKPKKIIFNDLPTNRLIQTNLLLLANKNKVPVVIFENNYRKQQFEEKVYQNTLNYCDLMILNNLFNIKSITHKKVITIPPFVNQPDKKHLNFWTEKLQLTKNQFIILIFAYNEKVIDIVKQIVKETEDQDNIKLIITDQTEKDILKEDHTIKIPFVNYRDISALISLSDIVIGKMGYMQFLETLSLKKIFISVGEEKGFRKYWLDGKLKQVCFHFDQFDHDFSNFLKLIINNKNKKNELEKSIALLHNNNYFEPKNLRNIIDQVNFTPKKINKSLLICFHQGSKKETKKIKEIIKNNPFVLPLIFYKHETGFDCTLTDFQTIDNNAIINSSFNLIFNSTNHSHHALAQIFPWIESFIDKLIKLIDESDEIIFYGELTNKNFSQLIKKIPSSKLRLLS